MVRQFFALLIGYGKSKRITECIDTYSTVMDYDKILVLNKGKVDEFGTPLQLIDRSSGCLSNGTFRQMCLESGQLDELVHIAKKGKRH